MVLTHDGVVGYSYNKTIAKEYARQYDIANATTIVTGIEDRQAYLLDDYLLEEWEETYVPRGFLPAYLASIDIYRMEAELLYNKIHFDAHKKWKHRRGYYVRMKTLEDELREIREYPPDIHTLMALRCNYESYKNRLYYEYE